MSKNIFCEYISKDEYFKVIDEFLHPTIYVTKPWVLFLEKNIKGDFVFIKLSNGIQYIYTYGIIFKKGPIRIYGSPFAGWNTGYIGLMSDKEVIDYKSCIESLYHFLRKTRKIHYFEFVDKNINVEYAKKNKIRYEFTHNMFIDLKKSENDILDSIDKRLAKKWRNYSKHGYEIVECEPNKEFADIFYDQLIEVFARQNLKPFYSRQRIYSLLDTFKDYKDNILCLHSVDVSTANVLSSGIYLKYKKYCVSIASAYYDSSKKHNMNHPMRIYAIMHMKNEGADTFDMCGFNPYKAIFGPYIVDIPLIYKSSIPFLHLFKKIAKAIISNKRKQK